MRRTLQAKIDDAVAALQPFYEAGEDGYPVHLALDALASLLGESATVDVPGQSGLISVLEQLEAPDSLRADVEKLYTNAIGGEYGMGLSKAQARKVNDLVQGVVDPLVEFIGEFVQPRPRPKKRTVAKSRRKKT